MTDAQFLAWLRSPRAIHMVLIEAQVNVAGSEVTRYIASRPYVTGPAEVPANTVYLPLATGGLAFTEQVSLTGEAGLSGGDIELANADGKLDSWLGDGHAQVSGGERARIAIARSLLADQPVLVLDEPAAHLDGATADELAAEVLGGERGRTVVWITHAAAGLDRVDRVVELAQPSGTRQTNVVPRG